MAAEEVIARSFIELLPRAQNFGRDAAAQIRQQMGGVAAGISRANQQIVSGTSRATKQAVDESSRHTRRFGDLWQRASKDAERSSSFSSARISKNFGGVTASVGRSFRGLGGVIATALAGAAIGSFIKSTITDASDLNETISKTGVIFGQSALPGLQAFAKQAATTMGQSQQQALDAAATFGIFGKSAGLQGPALANFSTKLVGLTSDMASFSNTSPQEAIDAVGAALRGESEPIRRYGVLLDDASTRQEAMRLGITKTTKEALTPQQRVLAVQSLIFKQTSAAQGDFARTSGGLANQQRILGAQFANFKATLGQVALPLVTKFFMFLNTTALPALKEVSGGVTAFFEAFKAGDGDITSSGLPGFLEMVGYRARLLWNAFSTQVLPVLREVARVIVTQLIPFLVRLVVNFASGFLPVLKAVGNFIATQVIPAVRNLAIWLGQNVVPAVAKAATWISKFHEFVVPFVVTLGALVGIIKAVTLGIKLWTIATGILDAVMSANPISLVIIAIAALVAGIIVAYKHSATFRQVLQGAWKGIQTAAQIAWPLIKAAIGVIIGAFELWWKITKPILDRFVAMMKMAWGIAQTFGKVVVAVFNSLKGPIFSVLQFLTKIFLNWVGSLLEGAAKALGWVPGVGPKLRRASAAFNTFKDQTNAAMAKLKDQTINVTPKLQNVVATVGGITRTVPLNTIGSFGRSAKGGEIHGPGTTTSDSIPTLLSDQEHVWSAAEVRGAGGHHVVAHMRAMALKGRVAALAAGGVPSVKVEPHMPSGRGRAVFAQDIAANAVGAARPAAVAAATGVAKMLVANQEAQNQAAVSGPGIGGWRKGAYGGVKPWVAAAGDLIRRLFGVRDIGGVGGRPGPSDHPSGHALDFMVYSNRALGNRIANYMLAHRNQLRLTYLIWYKRIASATHGWGWRPYTRYGPGSGPTLQHMDHVHASFRHGVRMAGGGPVLAGKGMADGAWKILRDQFTTVHRGEMVVPEDEAEQLRALFAGRQRGVAGPPSTSRTGDGLMRLHPDDIEALADAVAERPTMLDSTRLDYGMSNEATRRFR